MEQLTDIHIKTCGYKSCNYSCTWPSLHHEARLYIKKTTHLRYETLIGVESGSLLQIFFVMQCLIFNVFFLLAYFPYLICFGQLYSLHLEHITGKAWKSDTLWNGCVDVDAAVTCAATVWKWCPSPWQPLGVDILNDNTNSCWKRVLPRYTLESRRHRRNIQSSVYLFNDLPAISFYFTLW